MKKLEINNGDMFGNSVILEEVEKHGKYRMVNIRCMNCLKENIVYLHLLKYRKTGCKCIRKKREGKSWRVYKENEKKLIGIYNSILSRCKNIRNKSFNDYGGRGIKCEWNSFEDFYNDMVSTYKEGLVIDRIDNNGNYCKENCRWITNTENQRNKRNNIIIEGVTMPEFCERYNLKYQLTVNRYYRGWDIEKLKLKIAI